MSELNRKIVETWFEEVWNVGDEGAIDRLMSSAARFHGLPSADGGPVIGPAAFKPFVQAFRTAFPDIRVRVLRTVCERDLVAAHCSVTGTHKGLGLGVEPSGASIQFSGVAIAVVRDGQIHEGWNSFDFLSLYQQVGMLQRLPANQ